MRLQEAKTVQLLNESTIRTLELSNEYFRGIIRQQGVVLNSMQQQASETSRNPEQIVSSILTGIAPLFIGYQEAQSEEAKQNRLNELITSMGGDPGDKGWVPEFEMDEPWDVTTTSQNGNKPSEDGLIGPPPGLGDVSI